jgi:hypothetical protein
VSLSCLDTWEIICAYWLAEGTTVITKKHHIIIPSCVQNQIWPLVNTVTQDTVSFNLRHKNQNNVMRFRATNTTNLYFWWAEVLCCALGPHQNVPEYQLFFMSSLWAQCYVGCLSVKNIIAHWYCAYFSYLCSPWWSLNIISKDLNLNFFSFQEYSQLNIWYKFV